MSHASLPVYHRMCFSTVFFHCPPPQGNANVVEYLLESTDGESLMLRKDNKGRTPLDLASKSGHAHVLRVINAFRPTGFQRLLQLGTGKGGESKQTNTKVFTSPICFLMPLPISYTPFLTPHFSHPTVPYSPLLTHSLTHYTASDCFSLSRSVSHSR